MIEKTMGPGGDYADINSAINALNIAGPLSEYYHIVATNDILNTTDATNNHLRPNLNQIHFDLNGHTIITTKSIKMHAWTTDYKGIIKISNGQIKASNVSINMVELNGMSSPGAIGDQRWDLDNLLLSFEGTTGTAAEHALVLVCRNAYFACRLLNLRIAVKHVSDTGAGFCLWITGGGAGSTICRQLENCSFYGSDKVTGVIDACGRARYRNVVAINEICTAQNWFITDGNYSIFKNCADRDGSLVGGENTIIGVSDSDFISVDSTSVDFLKIPIGSKLRDAGTTDISSWNTGDFGGRSRPNGRGLVSIGAHEPISANVTLNANIRGILKSKTKTISL
jgi:hypothetical protein